VTHFILRDRRGRVVGATRLSGAEFRVRVDPLRLLIDHVSVTAERKGRGPFTWEVEGIRGDVVRAALDPIRPGDRAHFYDVVTNLRGDES
jgi:hypothetical protein